MAFYNVLTDPARSIIVDEDCPLITIDGIEQNEDGGFCDYYAGQTCVATHTFFANLSNITGEVDYQWETDQGVIVGGSTNSTFVVDVTDNKDVTMNITLTVGDDVSGARITEQKTSSHTLDPLEDCFLAFTDGLWIGYEVDNFGYLQIITSEEIAYAIKWKEDIFVIRMGDDGETQLDDTQYITIRYLGVEHIAEWNATEKYYECLEQSLLDDLEGKYESCDRIYCISLSYLSDLTISTDFKVLT